MNELDYLLNDKYQKDSFPPEHHGFWHFFKILFFIVLITILVGVIFSYQVNSSGNSFIAGIGRLPVIKQIRQLTGLEHLKGELNDRINFLLLGQGGVGHEGPYLTDTIMIGSFKPSTNDVALISIPRDFYLMMPDNGWNKINAANAFGESKNKNNGAAYTAKILEEVFEIPIHYYIRIDFQAFKQIIDDLGGVEVCVDKSFVDPSYPTDDFKTQEIIFNAGCQKMDGEMALKFARSRHGNNGEGSDFARAARQQKIIVAVKNKAFSLSTIVSPTKISALYKALKNNIQTNIETSEILQWYEVAKKINNEQIKKIVLDNSAKGLLKADISDAGAYVLLPRTGNYNELRNLAKNIFIIANGHELEAVNLVVLNGTKVEGLARDTAGFLNSVGFEIIKTGNASSTEPYEQTVIYKLKEPIKEDVLAVLKKSLNANVGLMVPESIKTEFKNELEKGDFLIILGCVNKDDKCESTPITNN
ncbi:MAG TPA: LCP family protein [bacterium]|nr:LCP family protein [bacterium]HPL95244.1 LCP family protein [bacterium]